MKNLFSWLFKSDSEKIKEQLLTGQLKEVELNGIKYFIKRLSASYILQLQGKQGKGTDLAVMENVLYELVANAVTDKKGNPVFSKDEVSGLDIFVLNSLITEVMDYNGLNPDAVGKAKDKLKNVETQSNS